jgi:hypothetical protein
MIRSHILTNNDTHSHPHKHQTTHVELVGDVEHRLERGSTISGLRDLGSVCTDRSGRARSHQGSVIRGEVAVRQLEHRLALTNEARGRRRWNIIVSLSTQHNIGRSS